MHRIFTFAAIALLAIAGTVQALDNIALPTDGSFYDGAVLAGRANADTTTDTTLITPRRVGDILIGGAGSGTNAVWVSKGKTTNDWVQAGIANDMPTIVAAITSRADTNASTTATSYTPRRVGDILLGFRGAGTNACWIAAGATTNDWVILK